MVRQDTPRSHKILHPPNANGIVSLSPGFSEPWVTRAWGFHGQGNPNGVASIGVTENIPPNGASLIPHVGFIPLLAMFTQKSTIFILKGHAPMMRFLIFNVTCHGGKLRF